MIVLVKSRFTDKIIPIVGLCMIEQMERQPKKKFIETFILIIYCIHIDYFYLRKKIFFYGINSKIKNRNSLGFYHYEIYKTKP